MEIITFFQGGEFGAHWKIPAKTGDVAGKLRDTGIYRDVGRG